MTRRPMPCLSHCWPTGGEVASDGVDTDIGTGVWRVDHLRRGQCDADVGDRAWAGAVEDEVSWVQGRSGREQWAGVVLGLRGPWDVDAGGGVRGVCQSGAVKPGGTIAAPHVGLAHLGAR